MNTLKRKVADSYLKFAKRSYDSRLVYDKIVDFWSESPATYKAIITFRVIAFIGCIWGAIHFASTTGQFWLYLLGLVVLVGTAIFGIETLILIFAFGSLREFYLRFAAECGVKTYETPQSEEDYVFAGVKNGEASSSNSDPIESEAKKDAGIECEPDE